MILNEKIKSYKWVFQTLFKAMDKTTLILIVISEDNNMKAVIDEVIPNTINRLRMWHIMRRLLEKVFFSIEIKFLQFS